MEQDEWREVGNIVIETTSRLFDRLGVKLDYIGSPDPIPCVIDLTVAVIGFAGTQMRGSLVLGATRDALRHSHPLGSGADDDSLRDWAGELANRLIGRIKIRLLAHDIVIQLGTPTTISGRDVTLGAALKNPDCLAHQFAAGRDWVLVRMEGVAGAGVRLLMSPTTIPETDEGEMLLF